MNRTTGGETGHDEGLSGADEALQWFVLLRSGNATESDHRHFQSWLEEDAIRRVQFEQLSRIWVDLNATKPLLRDVLTSLEVEWRAAGQTPPPEKTWRWDTRRWVTVVATLLVVVVTGGWWFATRVDLMEYHTAKGERRTVTLTDGSTITMNTGTVVATEFSQSRRAVVLREGEALFAVSHSSDRPFEVTAGNRVVRDVGTRFVVRRQDERVTVTVVQGAVEVSGLAKAASKEPWQLLMAGEQLSYDQRGALSPTKPVSLAAITGWVTGKVIFEDSPLSEALEVIGRYHPGEIRMLDPAMGDLKISGVFGVNDRDGFLRALERAVPVTVSYVNKNLVVLEHKGRQSR